MYTLLRTNELCLLVPDLTCFPDRLQPRLRSKLWTQHTALDDYRKGQVG